MISDVFGLIFVALVTGHVFCGNCEEELPKKLSAECRSTVDTQSADCWSSVGQQVLPKKNIGYLFAGSRLTVGNVSVTCR